jgi:hypothetical protein
LGDGVLSQDRCVSIKAVTPFVFDASLPLTVGHFMDTRSEWLGKNNPPVPPDIMPTT